MQIKTEIQTVPKGKPDMNALGFGRYFTDYMFMMDYDHETWHDARIIPYQPICLDPASMVLHYAQETFEGMKAYKTVNGRIQLFRPEMNAKRMCNSNQRLCMPEIDEADFISAVEALVRIEKDWIPEKTGSSLYLRPFMFASDAGIGVHASKSYRFVIIASPVNSYYKKDLAPVRIYVEEEYVRSVLGGCGQAKCGGNYAGSILAQEKAHQHGCQQVLWLDALHHRYIEEVGTMNVMFVIDNTVFTPPLNGSILPGITRDSIIRLLKDMKIEVKEEALDIDDLMEAARTKHLIEAFGCGTAALITPIGELSYKQNNAVLHDFTAGPLTKQLYETLISIHHGIIHDPYGWTHCL